MKQVLWRRAEDVFHAALEGPPDSRRALLDEVCRDEPELRELVDMLLFHDERAGSFLEQPIVDGMASASPPRGGLIGRQHGRYRFVSLLGAGGMGEVYRARDETLGRDVALKTLPPEFARDPMRLARFRREARTLAALNHPNIAAIYALEESEEVDYLVLELVEGETPRGPLPFAVALDVVSQVADALQAAHEHGIVHRDLKPANLKVTPQRRVKILDFGLAKAIPESIDEPSGTSGKSSVLAADSQHGSIVGTPGYMSPEQVAGRDVDQRTDIWAFGCLLYELLTGRRAFASQSALNTGGPAPDQEPDWAALPEDTSAQIRHLLRHCLRKDANLRMHEIADARSMIREAQEAIRAGGTGVGDPAVAARVARSSEGQRLEARRRVGAAAALAVLAVLGAATLIFDGVTGRSSVPAQFALTMPGTTALGFSVSSNVAVARDGSGVVYVGTSGAQTQLYWHDLRGSDGRVLEGTEASTAPGSTPAGMTTPFLSPDGRSLGFFRDGKLLKVALTGGRAANVTVIAEVSDSPRGAAWSIDDTIVYGSLRGGLWEVSASGHGAPRRLTVPDVSKGEIDHRWPTFLPGERDVLFTAQHWSTRADRSALAVLSRDTGQVRRVHAGGVHGRYLRSGHLVFGRDGTLMAAPFDVKTLQVEGNPARVVNDVSFGISTSAFHFDVADEGTLVYASEKAAPRSHELVWVTREGHVERALPGRRAYFPYNFALAPDGRRVATTIMARPYIEIWTWDLQSGRGQRLPIDADCTSPVWSPAGDQLVFSSNRDGALNLYSIAANGDEPPRRLGASTMMERPHAWSRDGRFLAYELQTAASAAPLETHILEPGGREARSWRWGPEKADVTEPAFSPDGRWLAYQSRESGRWEVWVRPFPGPGPRQRVSGPEGGLGPVWQGSEIYFVERPKDTRIMSRRVESTMPLRLSPAARVAFALPFALDTGTPYFSRTYAVAPDGSRVLVVQPDQEAPQRINSLNVITDWSRHVEQALRAASGR
jgi:Tol biopolymer transport system component